MDRLRLDMPELYFLPRLERIRVGVPKRSSTSTSALAASSARSLPQGTAQFVAFLRSRGTVPREASWRWRGHAYLVSDPPHRRAIDAGVMLIGDAAGLAYPQSGEGIRPAIESGLLAAATIIAAKGRYGREQLASYERHLHERFGGRRRRPRLYRARSSRVSGRGWRRGCSARDGSRVIYCLRNGFCTGTTQRSFFPETSSGGLR